MRVLCRRLNPISDGLQRYCRFCRLRAKWQSELADDSNVHDGEPRWLQPFIREHSIRSRAAMKIWCVALPACSTSWWSVLPSATTYLGSFVSLTRGHEDKMQHTNNKNNKQKNKKNNNNNKQPKKTQEERLN